MRNKTKTKNPARQLSNLTEVWKNARFRPFFGDVLIIFAAIMLIGAHILTNILIAKHMSIAETIGAGQAAVLQIEANPLMRWVLEIPKLQYIFSYVIVPSLVFALAYLVRKKRDTDLYSFFALLVFFIALTDFLNDLGFVLGTFL